MHLKEFGVARQDASDECCTRADSLDRGIVGTRDALFVKPAKHGFEVLNTMNLILEHSPLSASSIPCRTRRERARKR